MKKNYYLFKSGRIRRKDNTVALEREGQRTLFIPVEKIESISVFGEVDLNTKLLSFLSQKEVSLHIFNHAGWYGGSFTPRRTKVSGKLLLEQVKAFLDPARRLQIATSFIDAAMHNMLRIVQRSSDKIGHQKRAIDLMADLKAGLPSVNSVSHLMALEGNFRQEYYHLLAQLSGHEFEKREKQPPKGQLNCLISFGNTLLYSRVLNKIYQTHLDPTISYLHEPCEMRFSLALDISEALKPIIIDRLIISMCNRNTIAEDDYDEDLNRTLLNESGKRKFIENYETRLSETVFYPSLKRKVSYDTLIKTECYRLIRTLLNTEEFKAIHMWW